MDSNPIYCIQPLHDRFLVGSGSEAIVNIFDLRMPRASSRYEVKPVHSQRSNNHASPGEFSFFLSHHPPNVTRGRNYSTYRGSIYTMSSPSPTSATVYAGVVDGVVRLDFGSTDDLLNPNTRGWYQDHLNLDGQDVDDPERILELRGYERPKPGSHHDCTKLRSQIPFVSVSKSDEQREKESGWDRRWRRVDENPSWRSRSTEKR